MDANTGTNLQNITQNEKMKDHSLYISNFTSSGNTNPERQKEHNLPLLRLGGGAAFEKDKHVLNLA